MTDAWRTLVDWLKKNRPAWTRGPYITSATHALVTVLGLWPHQKPGSPWRLGWRSALGPVGVYVWWLDHEHWWLWAAASTCTLVWYHIREKRANGWTLARFRDEGWSMFVKDRYVTAPDGVKERTWGQRFDSVMDLVFPDAAWCLLALLWWL